MLTDLSAAAPRAVPAHFERIDDRFDDVGGDSRMEVLYSAGRWLEGPLYVPAGRYLLFSDIPNDRVLRWDETTGAVGVFRQPARYANGRTLDRVGRVISCEQGRRGVVRTEHDGTDTVLATHHQGRRLNSPNDVVERADGSIWFTIRATASTVITKDIGPPARSAPVTCTGSTRPLATSRSLPTTSIGRTASPSLLRSASSTSPTATAGTSAASMSTTTAPCRAAARLQRAMPARSTASVSTITRACGPPPATASTASILTAP